ncbi:DUF2267 domain-containing protein [Micromonosporaceae bacterium B7E4]
MNGSEFVNSVATHSGVPQSPAEALTRATLRTLAERLSAGEADAGRRDAPPAIRKEGPR